MKENWESRMKKVKQTLHEAKYVVLSGGAGLSAAAGLDYTGGRFTENFEPFIKKYGMIDMYTSSFYPFKHQEEKWTYWAQHISVNLYDMPVTDLYIDLLGLVQNENYFVITTNVERQFYKAGFSSDKIFAVQGDYGSKQCAKGCHKILYDNEQLVKEMIKETKECAIPSALVPVCPVCGGPMDVNVHKDAYFVQDAAWDVASERYALFLKEAEKAKIVFLELGVGYNTPGIIRYPFEQMTYGNEQAVLIRLNQLHLEGANENCSRTIAFTEEMSEVMAAL